MPPALTATPKGPGTEASVPTQKTPGGQFTETPPTQTRPGAAGQGGEDAEEDALAVAEAVLVAEGVPVLVSTALDVAEVVEKGEADPLKVAPTDAVLLPVALRATVDDGLPVGVEVAVEEPVDFPDAVPIPLLEGVAAALRVALEAPVALPVERADEDPVALLCMLCEDVPVPVALGGEIRQEEGATA